MSEAIHMTTEEAMGLFGIDKTELDRRIGSGENREQIVHEIREKCKKDYKKLSLKYHPDNPSAGGSHEKFVRFQKAADMMEKFNIQVNGQPGMQNPMMGGFPGMGGMGFGFFHGGVMFHRGGFSSATGTTFTGFNPFFGGSPFGFQPNQPPPQPNTPPLDSRHNTHPARSGSIVLFQSGLNNEEEEWLIIPTNGSKLYELRHSVQIVDFWIRAIRWERGELFGIIKVDVKGYQAGTDFIINTVGMINIPYGETTLAVCVKYELKLELANGIIKVTCEVFKPTSSIPEETEKLNDYFSTFKIGHIQLNGNVHYVQHHQSIPDHQFMKHVV